MRTLFTTQPGTGGFRPLVPFARALAAAGHAAAFACPHSFAPQVEAAGFVAFPAGIDWLAAEMTKTFPDAPPPGPERQPWVNALFRRTTAVAAAPDLLSIFAVCAAAPGSTVGTYLACIVAHEPQ